MVTIIFSTVSFSNLLRNICLSNIKRNKFYNELPCREFKTHSEEQYQQTQFENLYYQITDLKAIDKDRKGLFNSFHIDTKNLGGKTTSKIICLCTLPNIDPIFENLTNQNK